MLVAVLGILSCFGVFLLCIIVSYLGYKYQTSKKDEKVVDNSKTINDYLKNKEDSEKTADAETALLITTAKRLRVKGNSSLCVEALNFGGSGGTPSLVECKVRASDKNQQYQFNSDGTISDVSKKMCFKSLAAKQPVTKDPNVPVEDNINGGNIALFPCSSSESSMKWKVENGIVSQDNGAGRMKCWHPENGNVAQDKKIQTWYCDEITPVKFEQYDYTG